MLFYFWILQLCIFKVISRNFSALDVTQLPIAHCLNNKYYLSRRRLESVLIMKDAVRNSIHKVRIKVGDDFMDDENLKCFWRFA